MKKDMMEAFLVKCTIPEKKKGDTVYNCVWRAHRDVLTGRFYFKQYIKKKNYLIMELCMQIKDTKVPLCSTALIDVLTKNYPTVEFGAVQKLVNMTLKYLLIQEYYCGFKIEIDEKQCDCPVDSVILNAIGRSDIKWTSSDFTREVYDEVQAVISEKPEAKNGNICFDFKYW